MNLTISPFIIIIAISDYYNVPVESMISGERDGDVIKPTHIGMYLCKIYSRLSLRAIAILFNRESHCSVLHAIKSVKNQYQYNKQYLSEIIDIERIIEEKNSLITH